MRIDVMSLPLQKRTFGVSVGDISAIDTWLEDITARFGVSEQTAFRTRVCIAELANNVLEHGFCPAADDHIIISLGGAQDGIEVEFSDTRGPFDPTVSLAARPFDDTPNRGGRGLVLLHAYADNMNYVRDGTYNRLKFEVAVPH